LVPVIALGKPIRISNTYYIVSIGLVFLACIIRSSRRKKISEFYEVQMELKTKKMENNEMEGIYKIKGVTFGEKLGTGHFRNVYKGQVKLGPNPLRLLFS
jgi:hypothetical protein